MDKPIYVNVYQVTRHFGGHEEGGWWYNWYECVKTIRVPRLGLACALQDKLYKSHSDIGNIYSVNDGVQYWVAIEDNKAESQSTEIPHYE